MDPAGMAAQAFMGVDKNMEGYLNGDEIPANMKPYWKKYDKTGRGFLDLQEFTALFMETDAQYGGGGWGAAAMIIEDELDKRPTVYRAGKLPAELPSWFKEYD